jgi:hypothetical protein
MRFCISRGTTRAKTVNTATNTSKTCHLTLFSKTHESSDFLTTDPFGVDMDGHLSNNISGSLARRLPSINLGRYKGKPVNDWKKTTIFSGPGHFPAAAPGRIQAGRVAALD